MEWWQCADGGGFGGVAGGPGLQRQLRRHGGNRERRAETWVGAGGVAAGEDTTQDEGFSEFRST